LVSLCFFVASRWPLSSNLQMEPTRPLSRAIVSQRRAARLARYAQRRPSPLASLMKAFAAASWVFCGSEARPSVWSSQ
jgi:hypothetical protein